MYSIYRSIRNRLDDQYLFKRVLEWMSRSPSHGLIDLFNLVKNKQNIEYKIGLTELIDIYVEESNVDGITALLPKLSNYDRLEFSLSVVKYDRLEFVKCINIDISTMISRSFESNSPRLLEYALNRHMFAEKLSEKLLMNATYMTDRSDEVIEVLVDKCGPDISNILESTILNQVESMLKTILRKRRMNACNIASFMFARGCINMVDVLLQFYDREELIIEAFNKGDHRLVSLLESH